MSYAGAEVQRFEQERVALVAEVAALQATLRETAQERDECKARVAAMEQESLGAYADRVVLERLRAAEATLRAAHSVLLAILENNGGPTGGDSYEPAEYPDTHVLVRIEDFSAAETFVRAAALGSSTAKFSGKDESRGDSVPGVGHGDLPRQPEGVITTPAPEREGRQTSLHDAIKDLRELFDAQPEGIDLFESHLDAVIAAALRNARRPA